MSIQLIQQCYAKVDKMIRYGGTLTEAASTGLYQSEFWNKSYPRLQIRTIEQLLSGHSQVLMPPETGTFLAVQKVRKTQGTQGEMDI